MKSARNPTKPSSSRHEAAFSGSTWENAGVIKDSLK